MQYHLAQGDIEYITIDAHEEYSTNYLLVSAGQQYRIWCDGNQYWHDWFIKTTPKGYFNPLASLISMRAKGAKCFCLCGVYNKLDTTTFPIGAGAVVDIPKQDGKSLVSELYFFANDSKGFYKNNCGTITVSVHRIV